MALSLAANIRQRKLSPEITKVCLLDPGTQQISHGKKIFINLVENDGIGNTRSPARISNQEHQTKPI